MNEKDYPDDYSMGHGERKQQRQFIQGARLTLDKLVMWSTSPLRDTLSDIYLGALSS